MSQPIKLRFEAKDLKNMDRLSKSDPFIVLFKQVKDTSGSGYVGPNAHILRWAKIGQTEVVKDNLNPQFVTPIEVTYFFEKNEKFKI